MSEWSPQKPAEVLNPKIEQNLFAIADEAVPEIYARHDINRRTTPFSENGVLLPKQLLIEAAGLTAQVSQEEPLNREALNSAIDIVGFDANKVVHRFAQSNIDIRPVLGASLEIGEGTENNLPWYHAEQFVTFKGHPALVEMLGGWTSEEATHGEIISLVMAGAGIYDERKSVATQTELIRKGIDVSTMSLAAINAYTDPQERLTFVAHQASAALAGASGREALRRLAGQEITHKTMFRAIGKALYSTEDPDIVDYLLRMEAAVMKNFEMPGSASFPRYSEIARLLLETGVFTFDHQIESFAERAQAIGIEGLTATSDEAKHAQVWIMRKVDSTSTLHKKQNRSVETLRKKYRKDCARRGTVPFIVGETVELDGKAGFVPTA